MEKNQPKKLAQATAKTQGISVAASPFNSVKFVLAGIVCIAVVLWLLLSIFTSNIVWQIIILAGYSLMSSLLLIVLTYRVKKYHGR